MLSGWQPWRQARWQQQQQQQGTAALLLALLLVAAPQPRAAQRSTLPGLCLRPRVCVPGPTPTGFSINYNKQKKETGITITTARVNACSNEQMAEDKRAADTCFCEKEMGQWIKKSPALVQPASIAAPSQFNGLSTSVLSGVAAATACLTKASNVTPIDVDRPDLVAQLQASRSVKTLAGISSYVYVRFPILLADSYLEFVTYALQCVADAGPLSTAPASDAPPSSNGAAAGKLSAARATKMSDVAGGCQGVVSWLSSYAEVLSGEAIRLKAEVMQQFMDFLGALEAGLSSVDKGLQAMLNPQVWDQFLGGAQAAAADADMPCDDPSTCFGGVLRTVWDELNAIADSIGTSDPALDKLAEIRGAMAQFKAMSAGVLCEDRQRLLDSEHSQVSLYNAFMTVMAGIKDLSPDTLLRMGPEVLADIAVEYAGLQMLQGLETPAFMLRDLINGLADAANGALDAYNQRFKKGMSRIATTQTTLLTFLQGGTVSAFCSDGRPRQQCPINRCVVPPGAVLPCGESELCITDGCADCVTVCSPAPPSNFEATSALQVLKSWLDLMRTSDGLTKSSGPVKDTLPGLVKSLEYLYAQGKSPGDRTYMFTSGLLTFNRQLAVTAALPCPQGTMQTCYKYKKWTACKVFPKKMGTCETTEVFDIPNGFVPWIGVHLGLTPVIFQALDYVASYYSPANTTRICG